MWRANISPMLFCLHVLMQTCLPETANFSKLTSLPLTKLMWYWPQCSVSHWRGLILPSISSLIDECVLSAWRPQISNSLLIYEVILYAQLSYHTFPSIAYFSVEVWDYNFSTAHCSLYFLPPTSLFTLGISCMSWVQL